MPNTDDVKGRIKEAAGDLTGDKDLEREGKTDQVVAGAKEKVEDTIDAIREKFKKS